MAPAGLPRACDVFVAVFAGWTLATHLVMALGGSLRSLVVGAAVAGVLGLLAWRGLRRRSAAAQEPAPEPAPDVPPAPWIRAGAVAAALALAVLLTAGSPLWRFWGGAVLLLGALTAAELRREPGPPQLRAAARHDAVLLLLCALSLAITLFAHRPDADDAWLVHMARAAADAPGAPLLSRDTLHSLPGPPSSLPAGLPTYRLHSVELLAGAVAWLTPLTALQASHLLLPACFALLLPLAYARLLRLLAPERWIWAVGFALAFLLFVGDTHLAYGNFAWVRLHQGKSVMLCVALPLVAAYAIDFAGAPGAAALARLAAAQVAAVGLSASALWIAPAVAGLALACALPLRRASLRTLAAGLCASLYPLALGLWLAGGAREALSEYALRQDPTGLARHAFGVVLGSGAAGTLALAAMLAAGALGRSPLERRFALLFPLAFLLLFWNPLSAPWLAETLTSAPTYWRVFWVLPLPVLVGLACSSALGGRQRAVGALVAAVLALALVLAPARWTLSPENRVRWSAPGLKVPPDAYAAARALARAAPEPARVLAPFRVGTWLSTLHRAPVPLAVRGDYLLSLSARLGPDEVARRGRLVAAVSGPAADTDLAVLAAALKSGELAAVCLAEAASPDARRILGEQGFRLVEGVAGFEIWRRGGLSLPGESSPPASGPSRAGP